MHYYQHNIGDFASATRLLGPIEIGIAQILIDEYARTEKPLGSDFINFVSQSLASRYPFISESLASGYVSLALRSLFVEKEGGYVCPMLDEQVKKYAERAERNRKNASKPRKKKINPLQDKEISESLAIGNPVASQSLPTNNQKPLTNNQINNPLNPPSQGEAPDGASVKPKRKWQGLMTDRPDDVPAADWDQWIQIRKLKKLPVTDLAIEKMREEAKSAGLTLDQAVRKCIESGWGGFKASYLEQKQNVLPKTDRLGTGNPDEYLPNSRLKRQECRVYKRGI